MFFIQINISINSPLNYVIWRAPSIIFHQRECLWVRAIDCKKDGRRVSASFHYRKVKLKHLSMAVAILRKWRHLEPESAQ